MICKYAEIFCWKNVSSFCSAKATHIFSAKNFRILYIEFAKTVNEMTLNELVKLTTLWTTGPWSGYILIYPSNRTDMPVQLCRPWSDAVLMSALVPAQVACTSSSLADLQMGFWNILWRLKPSKQFRAFLKYMYSRTSLSRTRLFRITAYLEVKIWSLF